MLSELLEHHEFKGVIDRMRDQYTREVMSPHTDDEGRKAALTRFHLLNDILAEMAAEAAK